MKSLIRNLAITSLSVWALLGASTSTNAATIEVNQGAPWVGFMNVFEIPQNGGGYVFGSSWGTADLCAVFSGSTLTLTPNSVNDPSTFWYIGGGGPGAIGNKVTDASMYVEPVGSLPGQTVTFAGTVLADTLLSHTDPLGNGWTSVAFIKDFAPDYSSSISVTAPLVAGAFSVSLDTINDPTRHVQYGFETIGPDVWITENGAYGLIQIQVVPEPSSLALVGLGMVGALVWRRRQ